MPGKTETMDVHVKPKRQIPGITEAIGANVKPKG